MLDQSLIDQLKQVFSPLEKEIRLVYKKSSHADQSQLVEMLTDVASSNPSKIKVIEDSQTSESPDFEIYFINRPSGVRFTGIPNGHEFTSLILAILNADGKGKQMPDGMIADRIRRLKGPIEIRTFISLTCENCPEVVQALNIMTYLHSNMKHTMVDGAYTQDEIEKLGIQGVPSVIHDGKLVHAGKISFIELLEKLEKHFGIDENMKVTNEVKELGNYDVVVIGGGPAGSTAAIYSARKGLKTLILAERFGGQVMDTKGIENMISIPYTEGPQLSAGIRKHIEQYDINVLEHRRVKAIDKKTKKIELESGESVQAGQIIIATGAKWRELNVPGEKEHLGQGVAYCPHCDGPFYKGKNIAVIGGGNSGVEAAIDLAGIVNHVTVFEYNANLKADQVLVDKLKSLPNAKIITSAKSKSVVGNGSKVVAIEYDDLTCSEVKKLELDGVFVQIGLLPNTGFLKDTLELNKYGEIIVDSHGRTSVPGIYAAGDVTTVPYKQIIISMGDGAKAALAAFEDRMKS